MPLNPGHRLGELLPRKVAIFRALQLGDVLCVIPALRALRAALPEAELIFIGLPWTRAGLARYPWIDRVMEFPGFPGLPEREPDIRALPRFLGRMQEERFDLCLQMHGDGALSNRIVSLFGAGSYAGYCRSEAYRPDGGAFLPYPEQAHEIRRHLALMEFLGIPPQGEHLEFPLLRAEEEAFGRLAAEQGLKDGGYLCLHPGSRSRARRWRPEGFAAVARALARRGHQVVLTGSMDERDLAEGIRQSAGGDIINLAGPMSLGLLAAVLRNGRLLIANDTGVSHIACGVGLPSIILFTASDPGRWAPLDSSIHRSLYGVIGCRPCSYRDCPIGQPCAELISPEDVLREADDLLSRAACSEKSTSRAR